MCFYQGRSMVGTFKNGAYLHTQKTFITDLHCGDVVVIKNQKPDRQENQYVHRIVHITSLNFITRGDNNQANDDQHVSVENLIGLVTHYERNGKVHKVWNGRLGMMRARVLHGRLHIVRAAKFLMRKPYRMLKKTGIVARLWQPEIKTIHFETQDGPLVKYVHKGKTVASCWIGSNRWWFRRPYDFVIGPKVKKQTVLRNS
jgi:signal peptidase I